MFVTKQTWEHLNILYFQTYTCLTSWASTKRLAYSFHLCQSWRRIQNTGLSKGYQNETDIGKWLKLFFVLQFLKPDNVLSCFETIVARKLKNNSSSDLYLTTNERKFFHSHFPQNFTTPHPNKFITNRVLVNLKNKLILINSICEEHYTSQNSHLYRKNK